MFYGFERSDRLFICVLKHATLCDAHVFVCSCLTECFDQIRKHFHEDFCYPFLEDYELFEIGTITESGIVSYDEPELLYSGHELRKAILKRYADCYFDDFVKEC